MKKPKIENVLFYIAVLLALVIIAYCAISTVVKSVKENLSIKEEIKGTVFEDIIDATKLMAEIPSAFNSGAHILETYDAEGNVTSVGQNKLLIDMGNKEVTLNLLGVNMTAEGIKALSSRTDNLFLIKYMDDNRQNALIYFRDGTMVQHWLLLNGYATVSEESFAGKNEFQEIENIAKLNKAGVWKGD